MGWIGELDPEEEGNFLTQGGCGSPSWYFYFLKEGKHNHFPKSLNAGLPGGVAVG